MQRFVMPSLVLSLLAVAGPAAAQITQRTQSSPSTASEPDFVVSNEARGNYAVQFETEAIDATLEDGSIPRIVVRPLHGFGQLARPRLHFVPELLKSVEIM